MKLMRKLADFFKENNKVALAFSGGTDSSYLLYEAAKAGADVTAYYVRSQFQPEFEYRDAVNVVEWINETVCNQDGEGENSVTGIEWEKTGDSSCEFYQDNNYELLNQSESCDMNHKKTIENPINPIKMKVIELDILAVGGVACNRDDRCYHCKNAIITAILNQIKAEQERAGEKSGNEPERAEGCAGYAESGNQSRADCSAGEAKKAGTVCVLIDGNNASDVEDDRPGMRATAELGVRSPLRELGISKAEVRQLSEQAGLPTANKPAYACLATRVKTGEAITLEKLRATEQAETALREMGFADFRIRMRGNVGIVQTRPEQSELLQSKMTLIMEKISRYYRELIFEPRTD